MKKRILIFLLLLSTCITACTAQSQNNDLANNDTTNIESLNDTTVNIDSVNDTTVDIDSESTPTEISDSIPPAEDYDEILETLKSAPEAVDSAYENTARSMATLLIHAELLDTDRSIFFSQLSDTECSNFNYMLLTDLPFMPVDHANMPESITYNSGVGYRKTDFKTIIRSFYKHADNTSVEGSLLIEDDEYVYIQPADGEPWILFHGYSLKENENFILLSAPCYYGSNGGEENLYEYDADILFQKTENSIFGIQLVYAKAYRKEIIIQDATATSQLSDYKEKSYSPTNLFDHDLQTAWVENAEGTGAGEVITLHLGSVQPVLDVILYNGYLQSKELYDKNGKISKVTVDFGNGKTVSTDCYYEDFYETVNDYFPAITSPSKISLDRPHLTDTITITIDSAVKGTHYNDTCVSEIELH